MRPDDLLSIHPWTGEVLGTFPQDSEEEIEAKLLRSSRAFALWSGSDLEERCRLVLRLSDLLMARVDEFGLLMSREIGKPIRQAKAEVHKCAWLCRHYAAEAPLVLANRVVATDAERSFVRFKPLGPILAVMPWNFPFWQAFRCMVPALLSGNTVVLKHASNATLSAMAIANVLSDAGFPADVLTVMLVSGARAERLAEHPLIAGVALTGSNSAGAAIGRRAGGAIKPIVLELGGSNAFIIMPDADLDRAVKDAITGRFQNNGQSCIAAKRILVHREVYHDFLEAFVKEVAKLTCGNPEDEAVDIGPLAKESFAQELLDMVRSDVARGAVIRSGGQRRGALLEPTVVTEVTSDMRLWREETFGPVAIVRSFEDWEEAVGLSNDSDFGLGVTICTRDIERVLASDFREGAVFVNSIVKSDPRLPFGGVKQSGVGRELGPEGLLSFVNVQSVYVA